MDISIPKKISQVPLPAWKSFKRLLGGKRLSPSLLEPFKPTPHHEVLLFPKSHQSIHFFISLLSRSHNLILHVPEFFCNETMIEGQFFNVPIRFYHLEKNLSPCDESLEENLDDNCLNIVVLVHYFGYECPIYQIAERLRKKENVFIIEDCAHVLSPVGNIGRTGDIILYSPHKHFPITHGALCVLNLSSSFLPLLSEVNRLYQQFISEAPPSRWILKTLRLLLEKISPEYRVLYNARIKQPATTFSPIPLEKMSISSERLLVYYLEQLDFIIEVKKKNFLELKHMLMRLIPTVKRPVWETQEGIPYRFCIFKEDFERVMTLKNSPKIMWFNVQWPGLPEAVKRSNQFSVSHYFYNELRHIPIHMTQLMS